MKKEYILFIDSGIGGLSILSKVCKMFPSNFIYFSDNAHCPYGSRSKAEIFEILKNIIANLKKRFCIRVVVLACNTATTTSIKYLRETFSDTCFIGTEPAIKLASDKGYNKIGVLCTPATACQQKYLDLAKKYNAYTFAMPNLAKNIEEYYTNKSVCARLNIAKQLYNLKAKSYGSDVYVLGCTHYVLISKYIQKILGQKTVDGNFGVAKQVIFECKKFSEHHSLKFNKFRKNKTVSFESNSFEVFACNQKSLKFYSNFNCFKTNKNKILIALSKSSKTLEQKYIKTFMQILANKQNL